MKVGGPAEIYVRPPAEEFLACAKSLCIFCRENKLPLFFLGAGSNIIVRDGGIRGAVLDTTDFSGCRAFTRDGAVLIYTRSGTSASELALFAANNGSSGLEFLYGLPGTVGGAVYMNARCFEKEISDVLVETYTLSCDGVEATTLCEPELFAYKKSPFQNTGPLEGLLITGALFKTERGDSADILKKTQAYKKMREDKHHFDAPSAGSVFKNNKAHGESAGKIIEALGLRGTKIGGAQVASFHGNFIVNTGGATASDVEALVKLVQTTARKKRGIELESEIIFVGEK
jgi:UDP-N-acetylmuramate dehydrogenase